VVDSQGAGDGPGVVDSQGAGDGPGVVDSQGAGDGPGVVPMLRLHDHDSIDSVLAGRTPTISRQL
jgi:hypothetical protein